MLIEILLAIIIGILAGTFTGLIPGVHVNLLSASLISLAPLLVPVAGIVPMAVYIISMATTHSFMSALPSVFLGAPESATALGVLPGHRYLLKGWGLMAVKLTIVGSLGSLILSVALFPLLRPFVSYVYPYLREVLGYVLLFIAVFMIARENKKLWALSIFLLSGALGYLTLNMQGLSNPLFPLLSGLFGIATLLVSLNESTSLPEQQDLPYTEIDVKRTVQALGSGTFSGFLTSVLPGVGAATAAVISMQITRKLGDHGFMVLIGGISTANFVLSLVTLSALDRARNGALVAVKELISSLTDIHVFLFIIAGVVSGGVATALTLLIGRLFARVMKVLPYKKVLVIVITFIVVLTPLLSGWLGVLVLVCSTAVGLLPATIKTSRTVAMGCLLIPVISYVL